MLDSKLFKEICHVLLNIDKQDLEEAGVIERGATGGSSWDRFNNDVCIFVLKLPDQRRDALCRLIDEKLNPPPPPIPASAFVDAEDRSGEVQ